MLKILFLIHDLGQGGAEKVLINLVNNMDPNNFDITVMALFGGGVNEQFLKPEIKYRTVFPRMIRGNSYIMKLFTPQMLHKWFIKEKYDIEISYLEGPCARIISGCNQLNTKLISWIHCTMKSSKDVSNSFRNLREAEVSYNAMDEMIFVSEEVRKSFLENCNYKGNTEVLYNTVESEKITQMSQEESFEINEDKINLISVGSLKPVKGYDRLLRIIKKLHEEGYPIHLYLLGMGAQKKELEKYVEENALMNVITLLGYKTNPYKYVSKCDLFVCSSRSEGFSTAVTEALIVGTPVCTVNVSGMQELLGYKNEYGLITENDETLLYEGIKSLIDNPELLKYYRKQSAIRGDRFKVKHTVKAVEEMLLKMLGED